MKVHTGGQMLVLREWEVGWMEWSRTCTSSQISRNRAADLDSWICSVSVHSIPSGEDGRGGGDKVACHRMEV
jgi:hypothetical protein